MSVSTRSTWMRPGDSRVVPSPDRLSRSLQDLIGMVGVSLLAMQELADLVSDALAGRAGAVALAALGDTYRSYARTHPGRWAATKLRLGAEDAARSAGPRLARLMRDALSGYGLLGDEETHALRLLGSTLRGFVDLEAGGGFDHSPPGPDASWRRAIEALDALFTAWPAPSPGAPR